MNELAYTTANLVLAALWIALIVAVLYFGIRFVRKLWAAR